MVSMATFSALLKNGDAIHLSTHISAATHPKLLNLVPTECLDIGLSSNVQIGKLSNLHINEY